MRSEGSKFKDKIRKENFNFPLNQKSKIPLKLHPRIRLVFPNKKFLEKNRVLDDSSSTNRVVTEQRRSHVEIQISSSHGEPRIISHQQHGSVLKGLQGVRAKGSPVLCYLSVQDRKGEIFDESMLTGRMMQICINNHRCLPHIG